MPFNFIIKCLYSISVIILTQKSVPKSRRNGNKIQEHVPYFLRLLHISGAIRVGMGPPVHEAWNRPVYQSGFTEATMGILNRK